MTSMRSIIGWRRSAASVIQHVSESVAGAEAVIDWGRYTWMYPWIALGAAAAVGYLVYTGGIRGLRPTPLIWPMAPT